MHQRQHRHVGVRVRVVPIHHNVAMRIRATARVQVVVRLAYCVTGPEWAITGLAVATIRVATLVTSVRVLMAHV